MIGSCVRCQRDGKARSRADVVFYGLALCVSHEGAIRDDMHALRSMDGSDPEVDHSRLDGFMEKWAPEPIAVVAREVQAKCNWWATA